MQAVIFTQNPPEGPGQIVLMKSASTERASEPRNNNFACGGVIQRYIRYHRPIEFLPSSLR